MQPNSKKTGFCVSCRKNLIVSSIPEPQHERYLERIGAYNEYTLEEWRKEESVQW
jgi:hypothetical protein